MRVWFGLVEMVGEPGLGWMVGVRFWAGRDVSKWDDTRSARRPREIFGGGFGEVAGSLGWAGQRRAAQPRRHSTSLFARTRRVCVCGLWLLRTLWFNAYGKGLRADQGPTLPKSLSQPQPQPPAESGAR